jgi:hypothetical protein
MVDSDGHIVLVNGEIERMFGYSRKELLDQPLEILFHQRYRSQDPIFTSELFNETQIRKLGAGRELLGLHRDGGEIPIEIGLTSVATDEGLFVIGSIVDISERKEMETERLVLIDQLRHAQKLEAVGRMAGGIAHDFNNILGAIVGYAELAMGQTDRAQQESDLQQVMDAAMRGKDLINQILHFSRRQKIAMKPLNIDKILGDAVKSLRATIPPAVEIQFLNDPSLPTVMADETRVHQVIANLAANAAHAMPDGGVLRFALDQYYARDTFVRAYPWIHEGHYLRLSVIDSGGGMDKAVCERAFDPFFTTKPLGEGTGLGLAVVHGILLDHGGIVWIESEVGNGTAIHCLFPFAHRAAESTSAPIGDVPRGNGERILYVDDERSLAVTGERRLINLGYEVHITDSAAHAVLIFETVPKRFDLVITDYAMPGMNGVELSRRLTRIRPGIPILMITGFVDDFHEDSLRAAGLLKILRKPVTNDILARAVRDLLDSRPLADSTEATEPTEAT